MRMGFAVSAFLSGNLVYIACQFFMLLVATRFTPVEEVGRYALGLAIVAPIFSLSSLKLREVHIADVAQRNSPADYYRLRSVTTAAALAISGLISLFFDGRTTSIILAVAIFKAVESHLEITFGTLQLYENISAVAIAQGMRGALGLVAFSIAAASTGSLAVAVLASTAPTAWQAALRRRDLKDPGAGPITTPRWSVLGGLALVSAPLGVAVAIGSLIVAVPRYFLEAAGTTGLVGVFATLTYILIVPSTLMTAVSEIAMPRLAGLKLSGTERLFRRLVFRLSLSGLVVGVVATAVIFLVGERTLALVYGPYYAASSQVLVVLMATTIVQYPALFVGTAGQALQLFKIQVPMSIVTLASLVVASAFLVPELGLMGAAVAVCLSQIVLGVFSVFLYYRRVLPALRIALENPESRS